MNKKVGLIAIIVIALGFIGCKTFATNKMKKAIGTQIVVDSTFDEPFAKKESTIITQTSYGQKEINNRYLKATYNQADSSNSITFVVTKYSFEIQGGDLDFIAAIQHQDGKYYHKIVKKNLIATPISKEVIDIVKKDESKRDYIPAYVDKFYEFVKSIDKTKEFKFSDVNNFDKQDWIEGLDWKDSLAN